MKTASTCGIIGFNSPEYFFSLYGCWLMGAVTVGIYTTNAPDACYYVLHHSESEICVCQGGKQAEKIYSIRDKLPNLKAIIVYWPDEGMPQAVDKYVKTKNFKEVDLIKGWRQSDNKKRK